MSQIGTIRNATQLMARIKNLNKDTGVNHTILLQMYFVQRLIERIYTSKYNQNFVLKGGILIASYIGVLERQSRDGDFSVINLALSESNVRKYMKEITETGVEDGVSVTLTKVEQIMQDKEYSGLRVHFIGSLDNIKVPFHIDLGAGAISNHCYNILKINERSDFVDDSVKLILDRYINTISSHDEVLQVYLFGSYAYGTPHPHSDIDLMVVVEDGLKPFKVAFKLQKSLSNRIFPLDILVNTISDFEEASRGVTLQNQIKSEGILVYEKADNMARLG